MEMHGSFDFYFCLNLKIAKFQKISPNFTQWSILCFEQGSFTIVCLFLYPAFWVLQVGKSGKLDKFEIPSKIKVISEPWTPESGLVTAAMKLKREIIRKTFASELTHLYSDWLFGMDKINSSWLCNRSVAKSNNIEPISKFWGLQSIWNFKNSSPPWLVMKCIWLFVKQPAESGLYIQSKAMQQRMDIYQIL
jgi:hypothetical protein